MIRSGKRRILSTFILALAIVAQPFGALANTAYAMSDNILMTSLSGWDLSQTRTSGHNQIVAGGLRVWTDDASSFAKAAGYYDVADAGLDEFTDFELDWNGTSPAPGGQLVVDMNGNGTLDGVLVVEPVYGGNLWLANRNTSDLDLTNAPTVGGGGGDYNGTFTQWLSAYPDAKVSAIGYSLGSGVLGDGIISSITAGGVNYTFDLPAVATIGSTGYYTLQSAIDSATAGQTIELKSNLTTSQQITINKSVIIEGNGYTITGAFTKTDNSNNAVIGIQSDDVEIYDLTTDAVHGATSMLHGINVYESEDVILNNITTKNGRSGVVVGQGATVFISNITTAGNIWHGINVDKPGSHLMISGTNAHGETRPIFVDNKAVGQVDDVDGMYSGFDSGNARTYVLYSSISEEDGSAVTLPTTGGVAQTPVNRPTVLFNDQATAFIPEGTTITSNPAWDGTINAPVVTTIAIPGATTGVAFSVGSDVYSLTFDQAVLLIFPGQAGKSVGFKSPGGSFTEIKTVCNDMPIDDQLVGGLNECKSNFGSDLLVWTKHFTTFATFTAVAAPQTTQGGNNSSQSRRISSTYASPYTYDDTWMEGANTEEGTDKPEVLSESAGLSSTSTVADATPREVPANGLAWYWWLFGVVLATGAWSLVAALRSGRFNRS